MNRVLEGTSHVTTGTNTRRRSGRSGPTCSACTTCWATRSQWYLGGEELLDRLGGGDAAAIDARDDGVEGFRGAAEFAKLDVQTRCATK